MQIIRDFSPTEENPRNSEGAFFRRDDGKILFVYSKFYGGYADEAASVIASVLFSEDGREFLGDERILFRTTDFHDCKNIMCPSLLQTERGLLLYFLVRFQNDDMVPWVAVSQDGGRTFGEATRCVEKRCYLVLENDRVVTGDDGRVRFFAAEHPASSTDKLGYRAECVGFVSDDGGITFREYYRDKGPEDGETGLQEAGLCRLSTGDWMLFNRTDRGTQWTAFAPSPDAFGKNEPDPRFPSPASPMSVKTLCDGRTMAVFNPSPHKEGEPEDPVRARAWYRTPLAYRTSRDGKNWGPIVPFETEDARGYCYTAIFPADDFVLLAYCAGHNDEAPYCLCRLRVSRLEMKEIK